MYILREDFSSFTQLLKTLDERPNNHFMRNEDSSHSNGKDFTGTDSYDEAVDLLVHGYTDKLGDIKRGLLNSKRLTSKMYAKIPHPIPANHVAGFVPNIPNALKGLPESMITLNRLPQKRKTLSVLYNMDGSCGVPAQVFVDAGVALVSAINLIETSGIQVNLRVAFCSSSKNDEVTFPTLLVKSFGERFNLQKICFPLIHPSMFRRLGFKYLETSPFSKENYCWGYGRPTELETLRELIQEKDTYILDTYWIRDHDNSIEEIINELGVCI